MDKGVKEQSLGNGDNNCHHPCLVCGSTENKLNGSGGNTKMSPVGVDLLQNLIMTLTLDPGEGGGGGPNLEDVQNFICKECMAKFDMLESLQNEISVLEDKVEEILAQLRKTIKDRQRVIPEPLKLPVHSTGPVLNMDMMTCTLDDMDQTSTMTTQNYDHQEVDLKPAIFHFRNELDEGDEMSDDDPLGGFDSISDMTNPDDEGDHDDEPNPNTSRRCKVRATHDGEDDGDDDDYTPINESDTPKKRPRIPSEPSTKLGKKAAKTCSVCGKQVVHLHDHMKRHGSAQRVSCEICHKSLSTQAELWAHRKAIHLQQLRHKCERCGKGFYKPRELQVHLNMRIPCTELINNKKFICSICKTGCSTPQHLERHVQIVHRGEKTDRGVKLPVSKSKDITTHSHSILSDMAEEEEEKPPTPTPPIATAANCQDQQVDLKSVGVEKKHICPICKTRCSRLHNLRRHIQLVHKGQKTIKRVDGDDNGDDQHSTKNETDPDSDNANKLELNTHRHKRYKQKRSKMLSHASTKVAKQDGRHICPFCGKQDLDLTEHMLTHRLFRKKFHCETCNETFSTQEDAAAHKKIFHPQKQQVICPICKTGSSSLQTWRHHMDRVHHDEKTINCWYQTCKSKFYFETDLQCHLKAFHPENKVTPDNVKDIRSQTISDCHQLPVMDMTTHSHSILSDIIDEGEDPSSSATPVTENYDEEEEVDLKPVILDFQEYYDGIASDPLGGIYPISKEDVNT